MHLDELKQNWEGLASDDPMWAIMTNPDKTDGRWNAEHFFMTGKAQVDEWFKEMPELQSANNGLALDFGCGVGRLTQGLCHHFEAVVGVDISEVMIEHANAANRHPEKCSYLLNTSDDLTRFEDYTFDFICSVITLQHMKPEYIRAYLSEFLRLLKPGGTLLFSLPSEPPLPYKIASSIAPRGMINQYRRWKYRKKHVMEMYWIPRQEVTALVQTRGCTLLNVYPDHAVGRGWESYYYVVKSDD